MKTYPLEKIGKRLSKGLKFVGGIFDFIEIQNAFKEDGDVVGEKTKKQL